MRGLGRLVRKLIDALTLKNLAVGAAIFFIFALVWIRTNEPDSKPDSIQPNTSNTAQKDEGSNRRTNAIIAAVRLRDSMRNPDSFILEKARANDDGSVVCLWYRSQNGFGGMNRAGAYVQKAVLDTDADATSFHKFCVADPSVSYDVLQAANYAVKHFHQ